MGLKPKVPFVCISNKRWGGMNQDLVRVILICLVVLNGLHILAFTIAYILGYDMLWGRLGNASGGMLLWGYLLDRLVAHLKDQEDEK